MTNYFHYCIAGDGFGFSIVSTKKYDENKLTEILLNNAPFRCNVCGDVDTLTYDEVMEECNTYDNTSFFIGDTSNGWDTVKQMVTSI